MALSCCGPACVCNQSRNWRRWRGYVVDFLDFYWGRSHFPAFNVADMGITPGAVLLILDEVWRAKRAKAKS